jgi:predicted nucleotidyltransferase
MIDLTGRTDVLVAEEVLAELTVVCHTLGVEFLVVGAAARDLAIHALQRTTPVRATKDVDIAVAVEGTAQFEELAHHLRRKGKALHRFEVLGVDVDVVPFGGIEDRRTVLFSDDHELDVNGLREARRTAVRVRMPHGTEVQVASAPAQSALKILAWRDRHDGNSKDGQDLGIILNALSEDPFVDEVWEDDDALAATDFDIVAAASYHYARQAAEPFAPADGRAVVETLRNVTQRPVLERHMATGLAGVLLGAYEQGFLAELDA